MKTSLSRIEACLRSMCCCALVFWFSLCFAGPAAAEVKLPKVFGDHMVVQRDMAVPVWGTANPGQAVTVSLAERKAMATAGADGKWMARLEPQVQGGPYELVVAGEQTVTIKDVYVGEVWICSGQSNMQWAVQQSVNPAEEIAAANYPLIRMFTVNRVAADEPQADCDGSWVVCSPESVAQFSAVGFYFARHLHKELGIPVGMLNTSYGGTLCEAWTSLEALQNDADYQPILERRQDAVTNNKPGPNYAARLYNAMLAPLIPYAIRGAIWYQGESNVSRALQYRKLFPNMIQNWRQAWGQGDFPFLFVQLAPFRYGGQDLRSCAELWEAQLKTLSIPQTGMAVTVDIGDVRDIHPKNKQEAGRRLALWALAKTYGKDIVHSGPIYREMKIDGDKVRLAFDHVGGGLMSRDGNPLSDFTIAGEDQQFLPATATLEGNEVVLHSPAVQAPVAVRFAWYDAAQPNLSNKDGLPASPFRTDDWPAVTAGKN